MDHDIDIAYLVTNYTDTLYSEVREYLLLKKDQESIILKILRMILVYLLI